MSGIVDFVTPQSVKGVLAAFDEYWTGARKLPEPKPTPQPGWREDRLSRRPASGKRTALNHYNDHVAEPGYWLHSTKGYRFINAKRAACIAITADIKAGNLGVLNRAEIKRRLLND